MSKNDDLAGRVGKRVGKPVKLAREHRHKVGSPGGETFVAIKGEIDSIVFCADADRSRPGFGRQRARNAVRQRFTLLGQLRGQCLHLRNQRLIVLMLTAEHERHAEHDPCHDEPGDDSDGQPRPFRRRFSQKHHFGWVRSFVGYEFVWEVELQVIPDAAPPAVLGSSERLGWSTWLGEPDRSRAITGMVFEPEQYAKH